MADLVVPPVVPAMSPAAIAAVRNVERIALQLPQVSIATKHVFHAGLYARTIKLPRDVMITGALVKIPTVLIVQGNTDIWLGEETRRITGYAVLPAAAGRKQAFRAYADTWITMMFATTARTVAEAEAEFTDEAAMLGSRRPGNRNDIVRGA